MNITQRIDYYVATNICEGLFNPTPDMEEESYPHLIEDSIAEVRKLWKYLVFVFLPYCILNRVDHYLKSIFDMRMSGTTQSVNTAHLASDS